MLRSGDNLLSETLAFLENEETVYAFSAYIKLDQLKLLNGAGNLKQVVVRWEKADLLSGVADLDIYPYCKSKGIQLFRNPRIHLKALWNSQKKITFGSANLTGLGLGETKRYNYELNAILHNLELSDICYLEKILASSDLVTDEYFKAIEEFVFRYKVPDPVETGEIEFDPGRTNAFLLSQLPMSESPEKLFNCLVHQSEAGIEELRCAAHDIALYNLTTNQAKPAFLKNLTESFNSHPFIEAMKSAIAENRDASMSYGEVVRWITKNTTTVPTPLNWEIKKEQIVNRLYTWICACDPSFSWTVPGRRSQVIKHKPH